MKDRDTVGCSGVLKMMFNLNDSDIEVYRTTMHYGESRVDELADKMGKDRTTIYRSLERLINHGLCQRRIVLLQNGGRYYLYKAKEPKTVKKIMERCLDKWYLSMKTDIDRFERDLKDLNF